MGNGKGNGNDKNRQGIETKKEKQEASPEAEEPDYKERLIRLAAEFDNYKKRTKTDIDNAKTMGKAELTSNLLSVLDEFEVALIAVGKTEDKTIARGVELLYSNFFDALKKAGLEEVSASGQADPYKHEIIMIRESDKPDGTILEVAKKGYIFKGMLLRPASVIVSKKNEKEEKNDAKK